MNALEKRIIVEYMTHKTNSLRCECDDCKRDFRKAKRKFEELARKAGWQQIERRTRRGKGV